MVRVTVLYLSLKRGLLAMLLFNIFLKDSLLCVKSVYVSFQSAL